MTERGSLRVWIELSLRAVGVFSTTAAVLPVLAAGLFVGAEREPRAAMAVALPTAGLLIVTLAYQAFSTVRRAASLVEAVSQGPVVELNDDRRRAAFAVYDATRDATSMGLFVLSVVLVVDAGYGVLSHLPLSTRIPLLVLAAGCYQLAVYLTAQTFRSGLHIWVAGIKPGLLQPYRRSLLHRRFGVRILTGAFCFVSAMYAAFLSHSVAGGAEPTQLAAALVALGAAVAIVGFAAWKMGQNAAADVRRLRQWVRELASVRWTDQEAQHELPMRDRAAQSLSQAVAGLAKDFAGMTAAEINARRSVEQAERLKTRFLTYMSHDLRGPINAIRGFSDLLERGTDGPLNDEQLESVRIIRSSGDELAKLVTEVIDWSRLEGGRLDLRLETTPIALLVEGVRSRVAPLLEQRGIQLAIELPSTLPALNIDRGRMEQAIVGVVEFLARQMPEGEMLLRAAYGSGAYAIALASKKRLPTAMNEDVFRPFLDTRDAAGRRIGLSLGPALAKALAEAHGGHLTCSPGGTFIFTLPTKQAGVVQVSDAPPLPDV